ncbi:hypothetical protein HYO12_23070 [Vibrio parahaemolyticus]|uniref:hypothetical protein n=1 Tax=Vibrio parahaemolyticus TaxID=670 RepID=UPI001123F82F|nr:hypothetical protein [Vibrio parahaemolyticus]EJG1646039.1 hypothetical protein [Vibrio parahaemolyticus]MBM5027870.1 hypothetical protein [Vibrio parahaemolyticus]TNZ04075.1 hypothetical protein CGK55_23605 [Vibrio parahaemolyticus]
MKKELKEIQLKKTARDLRKVALDALELLAVNFVVFYYLIYQASKVDGKPLSDLSKGLKYSYETLFNHHVLNLSIFVGVIAFFVAVFFRPKSTEKTNGCRLCVFGFFKRLSRTLLSLAITLFMFKFVALTHGHFNEKIIWVDPALFFLSICVYIGLSFVLSYDSDTAARKNLSNIKEALKIILITLFCVAVITLLIFLELNFQCISNRWS